MKTKIRKQKNLFKAILLVFGCLAFLPQMQAAPAPDTPMPNPPAPGVLNTRDGQSALPFVITGVANSAFGAYSLFSTITGNFNTAVGVAALGLNNGDNNTAVGTAALLLNMAGIGNSALGTVALINNDNGANNTAVGAFALQTNTNGSNSTAIGNGALQNSTGDFNTAIGANAGTDPGIVSNNVYISDPGFAGDENVISIGGIAASGIDYENTYIGGIFGAEVNTATALPVYVDTDGHLGTTLVNASGNVRIRTAHGALSQTNLNKFQKQENRIVELEATVARLVATVKNQAAQIEKVSAQLEL
jgi:hypothetical protein